MLLGIDPILVLVSIALAMQSSYVSLNFAQGLPDRSPAESKLFLAISALMLGLGIWCMHFVGMLALKFATPVRYSALEALSSAFLCVIVVGLGFFFVGTGRRSRTRLAAAGLFVGGGIAGMHYLGMAAIRTGCGITNSIGGVVLSAAIGAAVATLALWLCFYRQSSRRLLLSAVIMGLAISGMHYVAVMGATFTPITTMIDTRPSFSSETLSITTACLGFIITAAFLLSWLPMSGPTPETAAAAGVPRAPPAPVGRAPHIENAKQPEYSFAGGQTSPTALAEPDAPQEESAPSLLRIPASDNGGKVLLTVDQVFAVQAYAHYTRVFDGEKWRLCDWSISEMADRLPADQFLRVHRSHIVNVQKVVGFRRVGDRGTLTLQGAGEEHIPISRLKIPEVRRILGV